MMKTFLLSACIVPCCLFAQSPSDIALYGYSGATCITANCAEACIGFENGLLMYTLADGKQYFFNAENAGLEGSIKDIAVDKIGNKWAVGSHGLYKINNTAVIHMPLPDMDISSNIYNGLHQVEVDAYSRVFITKVNGETYRYDQLTGISHPIPVKRNTYSHALVSGGDGYIYYASTSGTELNIYKLGDSCILMATYADIPIENPLLNGFVADDDGNFWISFPFRHEFGKEDLIYQNGGIMVFSRGVWTIFHANELATNNTLHGFNMPISDHEKRVFIRFMDETAGFENLDLMIDSLTNQAYIEQRNIQLPYTTLSYIDKNNRCYYYVNGEYVSINNNVETFIHPDIPDYTCKAKAIDAQNTIWLANTRSLTSVHNNIINRIPGDSILPADFSPYRVYCDHNGHIWIISYNGIGEYDGSVLLYHDRAWAHLDTSLTSIISMEITSDDVKWLMTSSFLLRSSSEGIWEKTDIPFTYDDYHTADLAVYDNKAFIISKNGLYVYADDSWSIFNMDNSELRPFPNLTYLAKDQTGGVYIAGDESVYHFTGDSLQWLTDVIMEDMEVDQNTGTLWYTNEGSLYKYIVPDTSIKTDIDHLTTGNRILIDIDHNSNIVTYNTNALYIYNETGIDDYTVSEAIFPPNFVPDICDKPELKSDVSLIINPNPAYDQITYYFASEIGGAHNVSIYDIYGQLVQLPETNLDQSGVPYGTFYIQQLPPGTYILHVSGEGISIGTKFIKL
ncbi:MAG: T9SS type A sorting domain-containing protein [Chitinophagales bacterium]